MAEFWDLWSNGAQGVITSFLGNDLLARATPGLLYGFDGWTGESGAIYIYVFDSATAVANGNPPLTDYKHVVGLSSGGGNFGLTEPPVGEYFAKGIYIAVSTTAPPNFTLSTNGVTKINCQTGPIFGSGQP